MILWRRHHFLLIIGGLLLAVVMLIINNVAHAQDTKTNPISISDTSGSCTNYPLSISLPSTDTTDIFASPLKDSNGKPIKVRVRDDSSQTWTERITVKVDRVINLEIQFDCENASSGLYTGTLQVYDNANKSSPPISSIPITLALKDQNLKPLVVMFAGVLLGMITFVLTQNMGADRIRKALNDMQNELATYTGLSTLVDSGHKLEADIEVIRAELNQGRPSVAADKYTALQSEWATFSEQLPQAKMAQLVIDKKIILNEIDSFEADSKLDQIQAENYRRRVNNASGDYDEQRFSLGEVIKELRELGEASHVRGMEMAPKSPSMSLSGSASALLQDINRSKSRDKQQSERVRVRWSQFRIFASQLISCVLAFVLVLITGYGELYAKNPTFGANGQDYVVLGLYGLTAEGARSKFAELLGGKSQ